MTIQHSELRGSRSGTDAADRSSNADLVYSVWGSNDLDAVRAYLSPFVPTLYDGLVFRSLAWEHLAKDIWEFTAHYVHPDKSDRDDDLDTGEYAFDFDTSGGTTKRMVSLGTTSYAKSGETAADFQSAIGVTDDGVDGVDQGIPGLKFNIRKRVARATLTLPYVKLLSDLTFHTNNASFLGFAAGELLFTGARGSQATESDPEVTFSFIASPNATGLTIGAITGVAKLGHEYLWVYFESIADDTAKVTAKQPKSCYVEQVYKTGAFSLLGIA